MKSVFCFLLFVFSFNIFEAQVVYEPFHSNKLGESREIKIQLPRGYNNDVKKTYPLFVVLDGDYMFEAVAGNVDYFSYWEDMPEAIIVGVNQSENREQDCLYSEQNSLPIESGANFFEFIGDELIPYMQNKYRVGNFKVAVGHGETANFINYYLLKQQPIFQGYIVISPELAPKMNAFVTDRLQKFESKTFYYLATTTNDISTIIKGTEDLNKNLSAIDNKNLFYYYDNFERASHYSVPTHAIPKALEDIFSVFHPISKDEYKDKILKLETSPVEYLVEKYQTINDLFGIEKQILINDFKAIEAAIEKKEEFQYFEDLGKLARDEYPNTLLGNYYLARFYEENGEPKKAMRTYQSGYSFEEIGGITKDLMLEKADAIKADFGY
ncbi:alpha/beta hydrolase-fold protein [Gaetbulibacter sp. M235]|uniref:alpha/beta hydrolase n=1 Tax=Gaetbulibacter sp. M235 TaxID=3126510 RepID=UPI00374F05BE